MGSSAAVSGFDGLLEGALADVAVPVLLLDGNASFCWLNHAAEALFGDLRGSRFSQVVAPEDVHAARDVFARCLLGQPRLEFTLRLLDRDGRRVTVEFNAVSVRDRADVVGVFALARPLATLEAVATAEAPTLTPRQHEILRHLDAGQSTREIASTLGLSTETVRNHIRALLRALGSHSRLEVVAAGRRHGLL